MLRVGLTGSIAMGKSTAAEMFADLGCPVFDSDAAVHDLYARDGAAVPVVAELFPDAIIDHQVDRRRLADHVLNDPAALAKLEAAVHPLVRSLQEEFESAANRAGHSFLVLDIPLLFETGQDENVDSIVVVTAPAEMQRDRALARPGMTQGKLGDILARQLPDSEKRARAEFIVDTGHGFEVTFDQVRKIVEELKTRDTHQQG